jgi:two-component system response regulator AlgR
MKIGPLRVLIVDDEAPARARLKDLLSDINGELPNELVGEAADGIDALECLLDTDADVALIDVRMPRLDGIGLAQHLAARHDAPAVIFTTAYDQYAVRAFELAAVDYLLKPVRAQRLLAALRKLPQGAVDAVALRKMAVDARKHLHSTERGRVLLVPLGDILFLRAELKYVTAHTRERDFLVEESLVALEQEFSSLFVRIHRSCLVARSAIAGCERDTDADGESRWTVMLHGVDERLPVSRRQWPSIKALLQQES